MGFSMTLVGSLYHSDMGYCFDDTSMQGDFHTGLFPKYTT